MGFDLAPIKIVLGIGKYDLSQCIRMKRGFINSLKVMVTFLDKDNKPFIIPTGTTAKVRMIKPDNKKVLNDTEQGGTVTGNKVIFDITSQMQAYSGIGALEIILFNGGETLTSSTCGIEIKENVHDDSGLESTDEWLTVLNTLAELGLKIQDATTATNNANSAAEELRRETLIIYLPNVPNYAAIATTYPSPEIGWATVAIDTSIRWRWNGTEWMNVGIVQDIGVANNTTPGTIKGGGNIIIAADGQANYNMTGDSKNNIVAFSEYPTDTDIVSGDTHTTLFGKILKSIKTFRTEIVKKIDKTSITSLITANDPDKIPSSQITYELKTSIDDNKNIDAMYGMSSNMYKDTVSIKEMEGFKSAIQRNDGTIKIAFVGESNIAGYNCLYRESFASLISDKFNQYFQTVNVVNFGLGSRNISMFNNTSYVAVNPETNWQDNFWRSWSVAGKSWKDHVKDYGADIIIMSFGHNDASNPDCGTTFYNNVQIAHNFLKTTSNSFIFIGSLLQSKINGFPTYVDMLGNVTRDFPVKLGITTVDVNKAWNLLNNGINKGILNDINITSKTGIPRGINIEGTITFSSSSLDTDYCIFDFRKNYWNSHNSNLRLAFGTSTITLYKIIDDVSQPPLNIWTGITYGSPITIDIHNSYIGVNGSYISCEDLFVEGDFEFSNADKISSVNLYVSNYAKTNTEIPEKILLGEYHGLEYAGTGGNGMSHPSPIGHYLGYYIPFTEIFKALEVLLYK
jgi:hypothetical protein